MDEASPTGLINEYNEKNNRQVFSPKVRVADLAVHLNIPTEFDVARASNSGHTLFSGDGGDFYKDDNCNDDIELTVDIKNVGDDSASSFSACFIVTKDNSAVFRDTSNDCVKTTTTSGSQAKFCQNISSLAANSSTSTITQTLRIKEIGNYQIEFIIDDTNSVKESRKDNNRVIRYIELIDPPTFDTTTTVFKGDSTNSNLITSNPDIVNGDDVDISVIGINDSSLTVSGSVFLKYRHAPPGSTIQPNDPWTDLNSTGETLQAYQTIKKTGTVPYDVAQGLHTIETYMSYKKTAGQTTPDEETEVITFCARPHFQMLLLELFSKTARTLQDTYPLQVNLCL